MTIEELIFLLIIGCSLFLFIYVIFFRPNKKKKEGYKTIEDIELSEIEELPNFTIRQGLTIGVNTFLQAYTDMGIIEFEATLEHENIKYRVKIKTEVTKL